jgi:hypothetical protein
VRRVSLQVQDNHTQFCAAGKTGPHTDYRLRLQAILPDSDTTDSFAERA